MLKQSVLLILAGLTHTVSYNVAIDNSLDTDTTYEYVLLDGKHPCTRTCVQGAPPMVCRYNFSMEWYHTMSKACFNCPYNMMDCYRPHCISGCGHRRPAAVVNRQLPGPSIEVCQNDEIVVDVENNLLGESTTIHWHGMHMTDNPYADGVPYVTQCPIPPGTKFRYHFKARQAGTHFWHSHLGMQRTDGVFGPLIVRVPEEQDPHSSLYDYDLSNHTITVLDWGKEMGLVKFLAHHHSNGNNKPSTLLVNGLGHCERFSDSNETALYTPVARFVVERGYRYRFRVINAGFLNCPIEISVDNHTLIAISSDGSNVEAKEAESIVTYAGERWDFILNADQPVDLYWMRFKGLMDCDERFTRAHQVAVLQYKGSSDEDYPSGDPQYEDAHKEGLQINALNRWNDDNSSISVTNLTSLDEWDESLKEKPDYKFFISYDFYKIDHPYIHWPGLYGFYDVNDTAQRVTVPQLNHISMKMPSFPLLPGRDQVDITKFCSEATVKNCNATFCQCPHVLEVQLNSVVEIILIDKGFTFNANHPFHLHGHSFRVVGMYRLGENVTEEEVRRLDAGGFLHRNLVAPPKKDTVTVPDGGYTILRVHASNPGYWLLHCHLEFHVEVGMALVLKVGEHFEMSPVPLKFPMCGDYLPSESKKLEQKPQEYISSSISVDLSKLAICIIIILLYFPKYNVI